jgi:hypothetical protein
MGIKQLNATYVPVEDRIVLRVSTEAREEFRFWLTRPITGELIAGLYTATKRPLAEKLQPAAAQTVAAFERETLHAQTRLDDQFVPGETLPLGETPRLVVKATLTERAVDIMLQMSTAKGPAITLRLTRELAQQVHMLLDSVQKGAKWNLPRPDLRVPVQQSAGENGAVAVRPQNKTLH